MCFWEHFVPEKVSETVNHFNSFHFLIYAIFLAYKSKEKIFYSDWVNIFGMQFSMPITTCICEKIAYSKNLFKIDKEEVVLGKHKYPCWLLRKKQSLHSATFPFPEEGSNFGQNETCHTFPTPCTKLYELTLGPYRYSSRISYFISLIKYEVKRSQ